MPQILVQCKNCGRIFPSGVDLGIGTILTLNNNRSQCPFCGSMESMPEGTFKITVEGIVKILENSPNRLQTAKDLLEALEKSKTENDLSKVKHSSQFSKYQKWIPDSLEKIYYYIVILQAIIQLLTRNPVIKIEVSNVMNTYNQIVVSQTK
jgi:hypothetical protein